jgi:shikimate dehydrogenase
MTIERFSLGLIGHPLEHSLSPRLHRTALQDLCLGGDYLLYDIPLFPEGRLELAALLRKMRGGEIQGLNVTIPHKQAVIPFVDEITPVAAAVGAVNTIMRRENCLVGDNTDVMGFMADLRNQAPGWSMLIQKQDRNALVLGAGGAARAVIYALASGGWKVWVAARRLEQAKNLIEDLKRNSGNQVLDLTPIALEKNSIRNAAPGFQLIVNATPSGMFPNITTNSWPEGIPYPNDAFVYDLVYNPAETTLVREACQAGLKAVSGAGMLVEQAALAFEIWTGRPAPKEKMLEVITASMRKTP